MSRISASGDPFTGNSGNDTVTGVSASGTVVPFTQLDKWAAPSAISFYDDGLSKALAALSWPAFDRRL